MTDLRLESVSIDSLTLDPNNLRVHDEFNLESVKNSLKTFGQRKPIVVNQKNVVLAGNGTLLAAKELGWEKILITKTPADWTEGQETAYAIADNRTAELAHWDSEALVKALEKFDVDELSAVGFSEQDLADLQKTWASPKDLDELFKELGNPTEEDNLIKIEFKLDPDMYRKWMGALDATGVKDIDAIYMVIQSAYDALTNE